ncbi:hypothetical protein V1478_006215 [Vespula squamosa]|uniref:Uncharacterized protein n=1 Tax=Vespula squamosa TaxID=30214 RepID=A0ABD2B7M6_VESSQ
MAYCFSAVPVYGSDKLPRLTYSIAPQFGNRGSSRSDVKTQPCRHAYPRFWKKTTNMQAQSGAEHKLLEATT